MGCLPSGSFTYGGDPADPAGPWDVEVKAVGGREPTATNVKTYLMSCNLKPAKVINVTVTPQ